MNSVVNAGALANPINHPVPSNDLSPRIPQGSHGGDVIVGGALAANQEAGLDQAVGGQAAGGQGVGLDQGQRSASDALLQQALKEKENLQKVVNSCFTIIIIINMDYKACFINIVR